MCVGVPGRILESTGGELAFGKVAFGDLIKDVNLSLVPEARVGDYVLVNMGTAVHTMDEAEAMDLLELLDAFTASQEDRPERSVV